MKTRTCLIPLVAAGALVSWAAVLSRAAAVMRSAAPATCVTPTRGASTIVRRNLSWIGTLLYTYENEHPEGFPPELSTLTTWYDDPLNPSLFWNPGDSDPCPTAIDSDEPNAPNSTQVSFRYFGGSTDHGLYVVLQDDTLANNGGAGVHGLLADSSIHFYSPMATTPPSAVDGRGKLEQIAAALNAYACDHEGHYPPALSALYPAYMADPLLFWNSGDTSPGHVMPPITINNDTPNAPNSAQTSFAYLGAGRTTSDDPHAILVQDNSPANNGGLVLNIRTIGGPARSYIANLNCDNPPACRTFALGNLRGVGTAIYTYANENADAFPPRLSILLERGSILSPDTFWNPGDSDARPLIIDNDLPDQENSTQISYAYFGGSGALPSAAIVLQDNSLENNQGEGLIVLTADTKTEFYEKSTQTHPMIDVVQAKLVQIGQALHAYAADNGGHFPDSLSLLYPAYIADPSVFSNPGDSNPMPTTISNDTPNAPDSAQISYHYRGAGYTSSSPPGLVLVSDNSVANNIIRGMNVLTADTQVGFFVPAPACPTTPVPGLPATQIVITGPDSVVAGGMAGYSCVATFEDSTVQNVTDLTYWFVSSGQGTFTAPWVGACRQGIVYQATPVVTADTPVTLKAVYYGTSWVALTATKTITVQPDSDGDGIADAADACPDTVPGAVVDADGCPPDVFGDADRDGDVDAVDFAAFAHCSTSAAVPAVAECSAFDRDGDDDVDLDDFGAFQRCYSGSCLPADPSCAD